MEVVVQPTPKKRRIAIRLITRRMIRDSKEGKLWQLTGLLAFVAMGFTAGVWIGIVHYLPDSARRQLVIGISTVLLFVFLQRWYAPLARHRPGGLTHKPERHVTEEDALIIYKGASVDRIAWSDFEKVEKIKDFILLYLDRGYALYVTRQDFVDAQDFEAYYEILKAKVPSRLPQ